MAKYTYKGDATKRSVATGFDTSNDVKMIMDKKNGRIVFYDDSGNPVILIGFQDDGF